MIGWRAMRGVIGVATRRLAEGGLSVVPLCVLVASLSLNVALGWKVRSLAAGPPARAAGAPMRAAGVQVNTVVPAIPTVGTDGQSGTLTFRDPRPTVLYIFSPRCGWCTRNEANIAALASAQSSRFRFIGVSVVKDGLASFAGGAKLGFPIFALASEQLGHELGFQDVTPQTVVVRPGGKVDRVWVGAYLRSQPEIERFFNVQLPGLAPATKEP
jgi:hypothetical protein